MACHSGCSNAAYFFLVHANAAEGLFGFFNIKHCLHRSICARPVILSVGKNQAPVKTKVPWIACRNHFKFCGTEILFFNSICFLEYLKDCLFCAFLFLFSGFFFVCGIIGIFVLFDNSAAAYEVKVFTWNEFPGVSFHLLLGKVRKNVAYTEHRVAFLFADADADCGSILQADNAVEGKGNCYPLVFFDSTVVMGVKVDDEVAFIERVLLYVKPWGIYVGTKNVHAFFDGCVSYVKKCDCLVPF